jgi:hypothetical protein
MTAGHPLKGYNRIIPYYSYELLLYGSQEVIIIHYEESQASGPIKYQIYIYWPPQVSFICEVYPCRVLSTM